MKMNDKLQKLFSGKGFYIMAAVSLCLAVAAIIAVYRTSTGMIKSILTTSPENTVSFEARHNETDESDPRYTKHTTTATTEKREYETSVNWRNKENSEESSTAAEVTKAVISNESYSLPLTKEIQREYSPDVPVYDETMADWRVHKGIDFAGKQGAEIKSAGDGVCVRVISDTSWGYIVEIDHGDFIGRYCGLEQGTTVKAEEKIKKGDIIGKLSVIPCEKNQPPHLHFEAIKEDSCIDPLEGMKLTAE